MRTKSFNARFWNPATGYLFDVVDGEHGNEPTPAGPTRFSPSRCDYPVLDGGILAAGAGSGDGQAADAGGAAFAGARITRTTKRSTTATSVRAMPLIIRARSGRG